jgi:FolB domain-containing protein
VIVEISGLEVTATHGVNPWERETPQPFLFDVTVEIADPAEDAIDATVDYRAVRDVVRRVAEGTSYNLLESLAAASADAVAAELAVEAVTVRVRKPGIDWADWAAATASRRR